MEMKNVKASLYRKAEETRKKKYYAATVELLTRNGLSRIYETDVRLLLAQSTRELGRLQEAKQIFLGLKNVPTDKQWIVATDLGELYMETGEFQQAESILFEATRLKPASTAPWVIRGACLALQERFEEACEVLAKGLTASGDLDELYLNLGYNQRALKAYAAARESFKAALRISPDYTEAKEALKDVELVLQVIQEGYPARKSLSKPDALYAAARDAANDNCPAIAVELLQRYLAQDASQGFRQFLYAESLRVIGRVSEAQQALAGVTEFPQDKQSLIELQWGELFMQKREFQKAEERFVHAARLDPSSATPWIYLGDCLIRQERFAEACDRLSHGLTAPEDVDEVYFKLGYSRRALKDYVGARECFRHTIRLCSDYPEANSALKDVEMALQFVEGSYLKKKAA